MNVRRAIELTLEEEPVTDLTPRQINEGWCDYVARSVHEKMRDGWVFIQSGQDYLHHWYVYRGRHYDAEAPEGVDDWRELPFFKRHFSRDFVFLGEPTIVSP